MKIFYPDQKDYQDLEDNILGAEELDLSENPKPFYPYLVNPPLEPCMVDPIPGCCTDCPNHPSNGGSGICNCTLPYFQGQGWITTASSTDGNSWYIIDASDWPEPTRRTTGYWAPEE